MFDARCWLTVNMFFNFFLNLFSPVAHAVLRKWVLLTDPDDKMAGVKVT